MDSISSVCSDNSGRCVKSPHGRSIKGSRRHCTTARAEHFSTKLIHVMQAASTIRCCTSCCTSSRSSTFSAWGTCVADQLYELPASRAVVLHTQPCRSSVAQMCQCSRPTAANACVCASADQRRGWGPGQDLSQPRAHACCVTGEHTISSSCICAQNRPVNMLGSMFHTTAAE